MKALIVAHAVAHDRAREALRIEGLQILDLLADADQLDRDAELLIDGDHDAALGGAIELRQDQPGEPHRLVEHLGLLESVLAGGRLDDHEAFMRALPAPGAR